MRRGDVRAAVLIALLDGPAHGYELIQALEEKTGGQWRPSPGSVYPLLQLLTDEDLVTATDQDGKRTFALTDAGRAEAEERLAADGLPWEEMERGDRGSLRSALHDFVVAMKMVERAGSPEVVDRATGIITQARKDLYQLLAE
jgi:DNA-binding PadR family transcriptional regulator